MPLDYIKKIKMNVFATKTKWHHIVLLIYFFMLSVLELIHRGEVTQIYTRNLDNH